MRYHRWQYGFCMVLAAVLAYRLYTADIGQERFRPLSQTELSVRVGSAPMSTMPAPKDDDAGCATYWYNKAPACPGAASPCPNDTGLMPAPATGYTQSSLACRGIVWRTGCVPTNTYSASTTQTAYSQIETVGLCPEDCGDYISGRCTYVPAHSGPDARGVTQNWPNACQEVILIGPPGNFNTVTCGQYNDFYACPKKKKGR
jgi:hypothetical protein